MAMLKRGNQPQRWDDGPLVKRVRSGDADAWGTIVERYSAYVNAILVGARVPEADQPDAFQYVFVELFKAIPGLVNVDYLAPWIRQTALRHAIRLRTKAQRESPMVDYDVASSFDIEEDVEIAERAILVRQAIASLKSQCQELIAMLFYEDPPVPYNEVAERLNIRVGSIGNTRQRCLESLHQALIVRGIG